MPINIIGIIILFTVLNISSFIIALTKTPEYTVFVGTVHYAIDYFYYLSYIIQGKTHWFLGSSLYSGETTKLDFHNWVYVLFGHMFPLFPPYITYQIMVVVGSILFLVVSYWLCRILIPTKRWAATLTWVLFLVSNAFPRIYNEAGQWILSYYYPWNNFGHPFIRLTNVPHHLYIQALLMGILLATILWWKQKKKSLVLAVILVIQGFLLASMQPVQWALVTGVIGLTTGALALKAKRLSFLKAGALPVILLGISGLIPALYLKTLVSIPPLSLAAAWEASQQTYISLYHFIRLHGPLSAIAIIGIPLLLLRKTEETFLFGIFTLLSVGLFFSPIPARFGILNIRILSGIPVLMFAWASVECILIVVNRLQGNKKAASWLLGFSIIAITLPVTWQQLSERTTLITHPEDTQIYIPLGAMMAFDEAQRLSTPDDVFLVLAPFYTVFPGLTGRRVYVANDLATIDFQRKQKLGSDFYNNRMTDDEKRAFLTTERISYIVAYAWGPVKSPMITEAYKNDYMILYKVSP